MEFGNFVNLCGEQLKSGYFFLLFSARANDVIELNVINGTLNLNLGGNVDAFEAVIGEPPATSSELTLIQALGKINQVLQKITIKLITDSGR